MKTLTTIEKTKLGFIYLVAFPDKNGIETEEGLIQWEYKDSSNRTFHIANNEAHAKDILKLL